MTIEMTPVTSSSIAAIGHDPLTNTLAVKFHGGKTYHYSNVKPEDAAALMASKSIGSHFGQNIRNKYNSRLAPDLE